MKWLIFWICYPVFSILCHLGSILVYKYNQIYVIWDIFQALMNIVFLYITRWLELSGNLAKTDHPFACLFWENVKYFGQIMCWLWKQILFRKSLGFCISNNHSFWGKSYGEMDFFWEACAIYIFKCSAYFSATNNSDVCLLAPIQQRQWKLDLLCLWINRIVLF